MTANPTAYPEAATPMFPYRQGLDPVRTRVAANQQPTNDQLLQAEEAARHVADVVHLPRGTCVPHPGDVLYWVTCVGGVSLLLIVAAT